MQHDHSQTEAEHQSTLSSSERSSKQAFSPSFPFPEGSTNTIDEAIDAMAQQIDEEPARLRKRQDVTHVLERMTDGVIVSLHIARPRFTMAVAPKRGNVDFGLEKLGIINSEAAQHVVREYFTLGRHSLLPQDLQKDLANIESSARASLDRFSFKTHWGYFVPTRNYAEWKKKNEDFQQQFEQKKQDVFDQYDTIVEQVLEAYRTLAQDAWKQLTFGSLVIREDNPSEAVFQRLQHTLQTHAGREEFIEAYVTTIQNAMPTREEIADAFEYEVELGYIPLPSLLAHDMNEADHIVRERSLRDTQLRAELDTIEARKKAELDSIQEERRLEEAKRRVEWQKLSEQQRADQEAAYLKVRAEEEKLRAEREKIDLQRIMDRDVIAQARKQKEQLVQEFYEGVLAQINQLVQEVCEETLVSLDEHGGILRGPVSVRLTNLVKQLKNLNFLDDEQIDEQIRQLEAVLPTKDAREQAKRGIARIETSGIRNVVEQIHREAEETLLELGLRPIQRVQRQKEKTGEHLILNEPRRTRQTLEFSQSDAPGTRRRRRGSPIL